MEKQLKQTACWFVILMLTLPSCSPKKNEVQEETEILPDVQEYILTEIWSTPEGLKTPESVLYDPASDILYVTNINGAPTEKDGNGFISKLTKDGVIETLEWTTGLNAPKGMAIKEDFLYVSDIDELVEVSLATGEVKNRYKGEGAEFLNDVAVGNDGIIYVTDMNAGKVYTLANGTFEEWITLDLKSPNGLYHDGQHLYVGSSQAVSKINKEGQVNKYCVAPSGVDGLKPTQNGTFIVSDWVGHVHLVKPGEEPILLLDTSGESINAADHEFIQEENILLVPTFGDDRVVAYKLVM
ncbi:hypothetical protein R9C00_05060 [Flammeovirgaceae bacterium SG7u.111]|nr:hypothetical protein [Flammeovirgaceae bacterium SG7u.132]WPO36814.1 hypothetical protein R9C00_05060 [Flammeovirgaceae bacterium SG7u.111]